jgi:hypothetical protein
MNASKVLPASKSAREHVQSICHAMTRPARLAKVAGRFFRELARALPESVESNSYRSAVGRILEKRRYRDFRPGLEKAADLAWWEFGSHYIRAYLADQQRLATTALKADRWNRTSRAKLSEVLRVTIRDGNKELNVADIADALTVRHGVQILAESIRARYACPEDPERLRAQWQAALPEILEKSLIGSPVGDRTGWKNGTVSYARLVSELTVGATGFCAPSSSIPRFLVGCSGSPTGPDPSMRSNHPSHAG